LISKQWRWASYYWCSCCSSRLSIMPMTYFFSRTLTSAIRAHNFNRQIRSNWLVHFLRRHLLAVPKVSNIFCFDLTHSFTYVYYQCTIFWDLDDKVIFPYRSFLLFFLLSWPFVNVIIDSAKKKSFSKVDLWVSYKQNVGRRCKAIIIQFTITIIVTHLMISLYGNQ